MNNLTTTSDWLAQQIASIEGSNGLIKFEILGDNLGAAGLPLVAWKLKNKEDYDGMSIDWTRLKPFLNFTQSLLSLEPCVRVAGLVC
jgi:hypothetical protein